MNKSVTKIPCNLTSFFMYWLMFTSPMHKMSTKDMEILSYILKKRYELSKIVVDDSKIDTFLFSREIRDEIVEEHGITKNSLQVALSHFRKIGVLLENDQLNKRFIPNLSPGANRFDLMILFDIQDVEKKS